MLFCLLINVKMSRIDGILTSMIRKKSCSAELSMKLFYNLWTRALVVWQLIKIVIHYPFAAKFRHTCIWCFTFFFQHVHTVIFRLAWCCIFNVSFKIWLCRKHKLLLQLDMKSRENFLKERNSSWTKPSPWVIKLFLCSSMKFKMLISKKISRNLEFFRLRRA